MQRRKNKKTVIKKTPNEKLKRRIQWKGLMAPVTCFMLALVLTFTYNYKTVFALRKNHDIHAQKAAVQRQIDDYKDAKNAEIEKRDDYIAQAFDKSGYSIISEFDYETALEMLISRIAEQDGAAVTVETYTMTMISISALQEYLLHGQDERFLGLSAEEIYFYESNPNAIQFYYIDGQTGTINVLDFPQEEKNSVPWWRIALAAVTVAAGAVMLFIPCMQPFGVLTLMSGAAQVADLCGAHGLAKVLNIATTIGAAIVTGNPLPLMLMLMSEAGGGHLATGIGFASTGYSSITVGIASFGNGPVGIVLGIINIALGIVDLGFAANEIAWEFTGTNYMAKWFNMSDELYYALGAAAMTATTVMIVASTVYGQHYQAKQAQSAVKKEQDQRESPTEKEIAKMRKAAAKKAKAEEIKYLKAQKEYYEKYGELPNDANIENGWGTAQNLTKAQVNDIINNGKFPSTFNGHHIKSVDLAKVQGDYASIKEPNNIAVGDRSTTHLNDWHNGKWATQTDHIMVGGQAVTSINRAAMMADIQKMLGGL